MRKERHRGQVEINETLLVLFIIVLIIAIGMFVYFRFSLAHVQTVAGQLSEQDSTVLLASIGTLPEISCTQRDCIDTSKLLPFQTLLQKNQDYYTHLLGYKKIVITRLYPQPNGNDICSLASYSQEVYPDTCASWVVYDHYPVTINQKIVASTFVSLYFPELGEYHIGRLEATRYV